MNGNLIVFALIATLTVLSALGVVLFNNPVRSALCLVGTFFLLAVTYFTLKADMLGISQIVVYAGAIMVLFLFVIMLLARSGHGESKPTMVARGITQGVTWHVLFAIAGSLVFLGLIGKQVFSPLMSYDQILAPNNYGQPESIGKVLFTEYGYPLEAVSVLLLVGIVGSILLAKRRVR